MNVKLKKLSEWIGKSATSQIASFACLAYLYFKFCYLSFSFASIIFLVGSYLNQWTAKRLDSLIKNWQQLSNSCSNTSTKYKGIHSCQK